MTTAWVCAARTKMKLKKKKQKKSNENKTYNVQPIYPNACATLTLSRLFRSLALPFYTFSASFASAHIFPATLQGMRTRAFRATTKRTRLICLRTGSCTPLTPLSPSWLLQPVLVDTAPQLGTTPYAPACNALFLMDLQHFEWFISHVDEMDSNGLHFDVYCSATWWARPSDWLTDCLLARFTRRDYVRTAMPLLVATS